MKVDKSAGVTLLGIALMLAGIVAGVWFGIWWAFIGGIVQVVGAIRADVLDSSVLAWGIARIFFSGLVGWGSFSVLFIPGLLIVRR